MNDLIPTSAMGARNTLSNWKRPGGALGKVVAGGMAIGGAVLLYQILPFLITLTTNIITLGILVAILGGILFIITDKNFQRMFGNLYFMLMRKLTGFVIELNPIAILQRRIKTMYEKIALMEESIAKVNSQYISNKRKIETKKRCAEVSLKKSAEYKNLGNPSAIQESLLLSEKAKFELQLATNYIKRNEDIGKWLEILKKLKDYASFTAKKSENEIEFRIEEFESVKEQHKAFSSFKSVVNGEPDEMEDFTRAMDFMVNDIDAKIGEMDYWLNSTGGIISEIDVEKGINNKEATALLQKFENEGFDSLFKTFQNAEMVEARPIFNMGGLKNNDNVKYISDESDVTGVVPTKQNTYF